MHKCRLEGETITLVSEVVLDELYQGYFFRLMVSRMHIHSGRFIEDEESLIFIHNG